MTVVSKQMQIVQAPGVDRVCLALRLFGDELSKFRTISVKYRDVNTQKIESVEMTVSGIDHEDGSGESIIVKGYAVNSMTSQGRVSGKITFWTRASAPFQWISIPFLI